MDTPRLCSLVFLTDDQRDVLSRIATSEKAPHRTRTRARILLLADRSRPPCATDAVIAMNTGVSTVTVGKTRKRFAVKGLEAALGHVIFSYAHSDTDRFE
jgi:tyrosine-protein phosphatase YwqE